MWRDPGTEQEQLDGLACELAEAGRIARAGTALREIPEPAFAEALRTRLLSQLPQLTIVGGAAALPLASPAAWQPTEEIRYRDVAAAAAAADPMASRPRAGRRWSVLRGALASRTESARTRRPTAIPAEDSGADAHVAVLQPRVRWQVPARAMPARWVAVGLAASLAVASMLYGTTTLFPSRMTATADAAVGATLVRDGAASVLTPGQALRQGDEVRVGAGGIATLRMGRSFVRLAPGADLRLTGLQPERLVVDQLAGQAYHRVAVDPGAEYSVVTGGVSWSARGTAFDISRYATAGNGEAVRGLALLNGLDLTGRDLRAQLDQGESAVVQLKDGQPAGSPEIGRIGPEQLAEAWLVQNARLDYLAGLDLGELAVDISPTPKPTPVPSVAPNNAATVAPTHVPTPKVTPRPTVKPTPAGPVYLGALKVKANYDGTYTFSWTKYTGTFTYYKLVYGPAGSSPYYPAFSYWACPDKTETSWTGAIPDGDYAVRLQAIDESSGKVVIKAQTNVIHLAGPAPTLPPTQGLGALSAVDNGNGTVTLSWAGYGGGWSFSYYKIVFGAPGSNPSYLGSFAGYFAVGTDQTSVTFSIGDVGAAGTTWDFRAQAIGYPGGSGFVFGQTSILTYTLPGA